MTMTTASADAPRTGLPRAAAEVACAVLVFGVLVFGALAPSRAAAQEASRPTMTIAGAQALVAGCQAWAAENDLAFAVAVYDEGANLLAYGRMDGVLVGMGDVAMWKGEAAARSGLATSFHAVLTRNGGASVAAAPGIAGVQGGVPVLSAEGAVMGAAGASGAAPAQDEACIRAGIAAAGYGAPAQTDEPTAEAAE